MISAKKLAVVGLLALTLAAAPAAWAGVQMYQGTWIAQSFGNDNTTGLETESKTWSVFAWPEGNNCNGVAPHCVFGSTGAATNMTTLVLTPRLQPLQGEP